MALCLTMINNNYLADSETISDSGGCCDFIPIKNYTDIGFKSFKNKNKAIVAYKNQKKLSKADLAPRIMSNLCKIPWYYDPELLKYWEPSETTTGWGYITELASLLPEDSKIPYKKIQDLVDKIWEYARLKFWDCHLCNIGYIKRNGRKQLVCIDTGRESFIPMVNAWGFCEPGPKCPYCLRYQCKCD